MSDDAEVLEGISTGMVPAGSLGYMAYLDIDNPGFKPFNLILHHWALQPLFLIKLALQPLFSMK